jgi:hypothetical protein
MKRPNLQIMGVEEGEEIQTRGTDNLFNRIISENFPMQMQEAYRTPSHQTKKETPPDKS